MNINALMQRIWQDAITVDGYMKTEVELSDAEWQLLLDEWPAIYGNVGNIQKPPEMVERLRNDWAKQKCFYLYGRKIIVKAV